MYLDFGISRVKADANSKMTSRIGTGCYMAPELVLNEFYDEKADVFAFAIIMFELIVETNRPYGNAGGFAVEQQVARNPLFRPQTPMDFVVEPRHLCYIELMQTCWKHNPQDRPRFDRIVAILQEQIQQIESAPVL